MLVNYSRQGGHRPPRDNEKLTIEESGNFTMWRSVGSATVPPSAVGAFAGQIDSETLAALKKEFEAAKAEGDYSDRIRPGSPIERIKLGDAAEAKLGIHDDPDGAWEAVVSRLRDCLLDLTEHPQAALSLEASEDGKTATLSHLGSEPLKLDLRDLTLRAVHWQNKWEKIGDWWLADEDKPELGEVSAESGWTLDIPLEHNFKPKANSEVVVYATLKIYDEDRAIEVSLESPRET